MILLKKKTSFILIHIQDLHSKRTMDEFVSEIKKQDFIGVSGRFLFPFMIVDIVVNISGRSYFPFKIVDC